MAMVKKPSSTKISIDFTGVESGGGRKIPDGEYLLKVAEVEQKTSQAGNQYLAFKYKVANGPFTGSAVWDNASLAPQALWRFRTLLECFGMNPSEGKFDFDLTKLVGKTVFVEIANETYQGKEKPRIANLLAGGTESAATPATTHTPKASFAISDMVSFNNDGESFSGKIVNLSGNTANVEVDGDEWEIELAELTKAV